ncbi:MAG: pyridoxine 5'-phosphate synthase [bacterium]
MTQSHARLSVNINKIALLRNSRGDNRPDVLAVAQDCVRFGAEGITVHPRPDQRHITFEDVRILREHLEVELNVEGYPSPEFLRLVLDLKPAQVTLVPDAPDALTSDCGWDVAAQHALLLTILRDLKTAGIRSSLFIDPYFSDFSALASLPCDRVELYTYDYAKMASVDAKAALTPYMTCAKKIHTLGLGLNAGHDLNQDNLSAFANALPTLLEVSIGHALICEALYQGLESCIRTYRHLLAGT